MKKHLGQIQNNRFKKAVEKVSPWQMNIDIQELFLEKGIEFIEQGDWLKCRCPFPDHDDSNPSFFIHKHHLGYNCYSCSSGNWNEFLSKMGWDIAEVEHISINTVPLAKWMDYKRKREQTDVPEKTFHMPKGFKPIDFNVPKCKKHIEYMFLRDLDELILSEFRVGFTTNMDLQKGEDDKYIYGKKYINRLIIPVHNEIGKVVWFEGREIRDIKSDYKYWRPKGISKTHYLFNFHRVKRKGYKWVIVVEGILDACLLWLWGLPAVCSFGASISDEQLALLAGFDTVYFALDNDKAGIEGWKKVLPQVLQMGLNVKRILLPRKKDALDVGKDTFLKYYYKAKKYTSHTNSPLLKKS